MQDIRKLFARSGKRPTRRLDVVTAAVKEREAQLAAAREAAARELAEAEEHDDPATAAHEADGPVRSPTGALSSRSLAGPVRPGAPVANRFVVVGNEPSQAVDEPSQAVDEQPVQRRGPRLWAVALLATVLVLAFGGGAWLGQALRPTALAPAAGAAGPAPVIPSTVVTTAPPLARAPEPCLETARLGDRVIDLMVSNRRGLEVDQAQLAYLLASRRCRASAAE
jgi:hypothetical protein